MIPSEVRFCDHSRRNERADCCTQAVETMQKTKDFVVVGHVSHPCIPCGVFKAIPEPSQSEKDNDYRKRRVRGGRDVGNEMAERTDYSYSTLSPFEMYHVVE